MEKIKQTRFDEVYYTETLANGLKVIIWHKPTFYNSVFCFATPFGAFNLLQEVGQQRISYHSGVAHFLEHKMFENENNSDVMEDFTRLGCNVNAFTSYLETVYHFSTTTNNTKQALNILLDFVQSFSVTNASVEKEKGIISEEFKMYLQMPDYRLAMESFKALFHTFPLNQDISGDQENIMAITKEELEEAHRINYHPSNMVLSIVTNQDPEVILSWVKENQDSKSFNPKPNIKKLYLAEPLEVVSAYQQIKMQLQQPKIAMSYKFKPQIQDKKVAFKLNYILKFWIKGYFTRLNPLYQQWRNEGLINDNFSVSAEYSPEVAFLMVSGDKLHQDFVELIDNYLQEKISKPISLALLQQLKRRCLGKFLKEFNNIEDIAVNVINACWLDFTPFEIIEIIESIQIEDFTQLNELLDFSQRAIVEII